MSPEHLLLQTARAWVQAGRPATLVEVARHQGSVPREKGTRMLVSAAEVVGTIGGGHLELRAIADARAYLARASHEPLLQDIKLGPSLGQCCGGVLQLRFTRLQACSIETWPIRPPLFQLQLYGAGHVGRAIVRLLAMLHCQVQWIDERESEFPHEPLPSHIERVCVEPVQAEVQTAPPGSFYLVLTHSHDLDLALSEAILRRGDFGYFGLIGSKTKRARFERRLAAKGIDDGTLGRMTCPIGAPAIVGKEPEVLAVAVVAQLLASLPAGL